MGRPFPVLLFSHGLGNCPYDYTIQLEDLASHGYVVAGVEHPGDSLGVALPNGTILPFDEALWEKHPTSSTEPETARFYEARGQTSARDLLFVLDRLAELAGKKNRYFTAFSMWTVWALSGTQAEAARQRLPASSISESEPV